MGGRITIVQDPWEEIRCVRRVRFYADPFDVTTVSVSWLAL